MIAFLLIVFAALGGLVLAELSTGATLDTLPGPPIAAAVIGALFVLYFTSLGWRGERSMTRVILFIGGLAATSAVAMKFNGQASAFVASLLASTPSQAKQAPSPPAAQASVRIRRASDGTFRVYGEIDGEVLTLGIDSGAATVVLRHSDAERAGIDVASLNYNTAFKSANGTSYLAPVRLKSVRVGALLLADVEGLVAQPGTVNESLLGISFLRRLTSYELSGEFATLRQ